MPDHGLLDVLRRSGGLVAVSKQLDIAPPTALAAAGALLPLIRGAMRRRVERASDLTTGLVELVALLEHLGGGQLAGRVLQHDIDPATADRVLAALFGDDEVLRLVVADAATQSEVEPAVVAEVLPLMGMLASGYVSARAGRMSPAERLAELGPLLDLDGGPNPLDVVTGIADH